jgi:serine/threonine-protein kinase RsbW
MKAKYTIESNLDHVSDVGLGIRDFTKKCGLSSQHIADIELCAVEAMNNAILHACGNGTDKIIEISLDGTDTEVELRIIDDGLPMESFSTPSLQYDPADLNSLPEGGMGLYLIFTIMDEVSYSSDGQHNVLIMKKKII